MFMYLYDNDIYPRARVVVIALDMDNRVKHNTRLELAAAHRPDGRPRRVDVEAQRRLRVDAAAAGRLI